MATIGELSVLLKLVGLDKFKSDLQRATAETQKAGRSVEELGSFFKTHTIAINRTSEELKKMSVEVRRFGREVNATLKPVGLLGLAITGAFTGAFIAASKELPSVDFALKDVKNSFEEIAKSVAIAALPALKEFAGFLSIASNIIKGLAQSNPELINGILKLGAALAGLNVGRVVFKILTDGLSGFFAILSKIIPLVGLGNINLTATLGIVTGLAAALLVLGDRVTTTGQKLLAFSQQGFLGLGALFSTKGGGKQMLDEFEALMKRIQELSKQGTQETQDLFGRMTRGIRSSFKDLATNLEELFASIGQALENNLGQGIFEAITGRIHGLKSLLKSLGEDILKAFSKNIANTILGKVIGTPDKAGFLGGLPGLGFLGGKGTKQTSQNAPGNTTDTVRNLNQEIASTTGNFKQLQIAKDQTIANFQNLTSTLQNTMQGIMSFFGAVAQTISNLLQFIVQGFATAIQNIVSFSQSLFSLLGGAKKGGGVLGGLLSFGGAILGSIIAPGIGTVLGGSLGSIGKAVGGLFGGGASPLPAGAGIELGAGALTHLAEGGVVRKPTIAMVGESGPEVVTPLDQAGSMGGIHLHLHSDVTFADNPASIDKMARKLADGFIRITNRRTGGTALTA